MKKVGILSTFGAWDEAYSPINVVRHQLLSLLRYDYKPVLFVLDSFTPDFAIEGVEIRRVLPTLKFEPYHGIIHHRNVPNEFEKDLAKVVPVYEQQFKDIDVLLCHDVIFQDSFLPYNAALHKMVMPTNLRLFHWTHSGPSKRMADLQYPINCLFTIPPQSKLIYMNRYDVTRMAEMYGVYQDSIRVVHNPIDYRLQEGIEALTDQIISHFGCNDADIIAVYPLSSTRMGDGGKQLHKALRVMANLKKLGNKVRYIIPNAHANAAAEKEAIQKMRAIGKEYGLDPRYDIIFTSLIDPQWEHGIPHKVVVELMDYADIFLFPSVSENCPLTLLEAAMGKNLLVLNEDFSPMKDFVGPNALYFKFDSVTTVTSHPQGEDKYYEDVAKIINAELQHNKIYLAHREIRQKFNIDYIFKKQLEPLFFEEQKKEEKKKVEVPKDAAEPKDQDMLDLPSQGGPDVLGEQ